MTTITAPAPARAAQTAAIRVTFGRLVRAEWLKLSTLKSTWLTLGLFVIPSAVASPLLCVWLLTAGDSSTVTSGAVFAAGMAMQTLMAVGVIILPVFGALAATGEFKAGQLQATFLSAPRRLTALGAKALVTALVAAAATIATAVVCTAVNAAVVRGFGFPIQFTDEWRIVVGGAFALTCLALFAHAIGWLLKSSAAAICVTFVILVAVPQVLSLPFAEWTIRLYEFWPSTLANSLVNAPLQIPAYIAAMALWALVPLAAAAVVVRRRDV
jgi:ABC-2 type transport system permease protein